MIRFPKKKKELTRREIVAMRRRESANEASEPNTFQMSRNLGSRARMSREEEKSSDRQATWKLRKERRKLSTWFIYTMSVVALSLLILTQLSARIEAEATGTSSDFQRGEYSKALNDYFSARPIERLRFMVNESALHSFFLERTPEVKSLSLSGGGGLGVTKLQVSFREPVVQWKSSNKTFYVDNLGVTFEKNYFENPSLAVRDESGVPASAGQEVINRRFLSFLGQSVSEFNKLGFEVTEAVMPVNTVRQVTFKISGKPYSIKMTIDRGASAQVAEASKAIAFLDSTGRAPEYVDVRVDQRVFYK